MRDTRDTSANSAPEPITAESIVKDIILDDDPENIRETLTDMVLQIFMYANPSDEFKGSIYCAYSTLYDALKKMEQLNPRRKGAKPCTM